MKKIFFILLLSSLSLSPLRAQVAIGTTSPDASAALELNANGACAGEPTEFSFYGLTYKPVESNGKCWLDRNLGASQVATSLNDPASYGDLYQWGRVADGHENPTSTLYTAESSGAGVANFNNDPANAWIGEFIIRDNGANNWVDPSIKGVDYLWQGLNGTNNPCPSGYHIPTEADLTTERSSWSSFNSAGAFASPLKLPAAGSRSRAANGLVYDEGSTGAYWSSTLSSADAKAFYISSSGATMGVSNRAYGRSVRCIKN